jgi:hypothetical protein
MEVAEELNKQLLKVMVMEVVDLRQQLLQAMETEEEQQQPQHQILEAAEEQHPLRHQILEVVEEQHPLQHQILQAVEEPLQLRTQEEVMEEEEQLHQHRPL